MLLSGKDSDRLGVQETTGPQGETLEFTNIERTLIDITVRPAYAGGVQNVLHSYVQASENTNVQQLAEMLVELEYLYPYHQAVGFFLQSAGYQAEALAVLREPGLHHDFFLAHGMGKTKYDPEWRIHYPADFTGT
jgi:predicted transcriptional regulator of viral defense system